MVAMSSADLIHVTAGMLDSGNTGFAIASELA
jgi:hypothetical protein